MIQLLSGMVIGGVAGVMLKDKILGESAKEEAKKREINNLYTENEKFSKRNKELQRHVEDLMSELNKARRKAKESDDDQDNLEDELERAKRELKNLRFQNDDLNRKVKELKIACEAQELEIQSLKLNNQ